MRVLISGAGVAGLTVAYWLRRYGFTATIVDRANSLLTGGYKIDVRGSALHVLRRMGIYETIVGAGTDMQGALLVDRNGKVIQQMSGDEFGHRVGDDVEIIRGTLCQILMDQVLDAEFIFGDCIQEISQCSDRVEVKFQSNKVRDFDLVIGADGLHSNVRQLVFGEESLFSQHLGLYLCVFTVPNYLNLDRMEMQYSELGRVASVWSASGEPQAKACFGFTTPQSIKIDLRDVEQQQQVLKNVYEGIGWEIPRFLQIMPNSPDFYFDAAAQIHMDHWSQGRVILLGDAAYCASPMSGQGTSLAIIGAYVLAGELAAANGNHQIAFEEYEKLMRPFVRLNQELGIKAAQVMRSQEKNNLLSWLLKRLMETAPSYLIKFFINCSTRRINKAARSIKLKDY
ncbi:FAD-dependent monooxygenase [Legionella sp. WA2022007384]